MFVRHCISQNGMPPTRKEISRRFGWSSTNASDRVIVALEKKGYLSRVPGIARGIRVTRGDGNGKSKP